MHTVNSMKNLTQASRYPVCPAQTLWGYPGGWTVRSL